MPESISSIVQTYTQRFQVRKPYFPDPPSKDLSLIIAIPAYKEPDIFSTLNALASCRQPSGSVEVIITVNAPEDAPEEVLAINRKTVEQIKQWESNNKCDHLKILLIREEAIPKKQAGAGAARKIGMDEAVQRWAMLNTDGAIVCLDADCTVSENYLQEAENVFADPFVRVGHFNFEHDYKNEPDASLREGIVNYELHLRCYIQGLKMAGYPFAVHTVGSCMAVRASAYAKAGGMNNRKAGEDFYFIHKLVPQGGWKNIVKATVFPSCRASDRVPFGTGRAQLEWQQEIYKSQTPKTMPGSQQALHAEVQMLSYNADIYLLMKPLFEKLPELFQQEINMKHFHPAVKEFLLEQKILSAVPEMKKHSNSRDTFAKRCWQWLDGFRVLKLTHYLRDHGFSDQPVLKVALTLLGSSEHSHISDPKSLLTLFRERDKLPG